LADVNEAIRLFQEHKFRDNYWVYDTYCMRGYIRTDLEDFAGAIQDLNQALSLVPKGYRARFLRARARELNGDLEGAIEDYSEVILKGQDDAVAFDNRGDLYRQQGHLEQALADYSEAIRLEPSEWLYHYDRGSAYAEKGDIQLAISDYQQALKHYPDDDLGDTKREMLDFIADHPDLS